MSIGMRPSRRKGMQVVVMSIRKTRSHILALYSNTDHYNRVGEKGNLTLCGLPTYDVQVASNRNDATCLRCRKIRDGR